MTFSKWALDKKAQEGIQIKDTGLEATIVATNSGPNKTVKGKYLGNVSHLANVCINTLGWKSP